MYSEARDITPAGRRQTAHWPDHRPDHRQRGWTLIAWITLLLVLWLSSAAAWAAEPIGKLIVAAGKIEAIGADGTTRRLRRQAPIYAGDTVVTGSNVFAQMRLTDGALIQLRPDTEFKIEEYEWNGAEDGTERSLFKLIKGGFRTITGAIGHKNKENYQVSTPVATIGIRGTHYGARMVTPELAAQRRAAGGDAREGLYGGVVDGEVRVANAGGAGNFGNDRYFFVANRNTPPEALLGPPGLVFDEDEVDGGNEDEEQADDADAPDEGNGEDPQDADGDGPGDGQGDDQTDGEGGGDAGDANADGADDGSDAGTGADTPGSGDTGAADTGTGTDADAGTGSGDLTGGGETVATPDDLGTAAPTTTRTEPVVTANPTTTVEDVVETSYIRAPSGAQTTIAFISQVGGLPELITARIADDGTNDNAILYTRETGGNARVTQVAESHVDGGNTVTHRFNFGGATQVEGGVHSASTASWGRWSGAFTVTENGNPVTPLTDIHYIYSDMMAAYADVTGAATRAEPITVFDFVNSATTTPTDLSGNTGSLEYFTVAVDFQNQTLIDFDVKAVIDAKTYEVGLASTTNPLANVFSSQSILLSGNCSGCTTTSVTGDGTLTFLDPALNYLGASYALRSTDGSSGVAGAGILDTLLTRSASSSAPTNAIAHLAFVTPQASTYQREVMALKQDGSNDDIQIATVNMTGNVVMKASEDFNSVSSSRVMDVERSELVDTGGSTVGVNWGRWTDGWSAVVGGVGTGASGHAHFIYSDKLSTVTTPTWTVATFNFLGGTSPTDESGNVGSITSASMTVNATSVPIITAFTVVADFSSTTGRTWNLAAGSTAVSPTTAPMAQLSLSGTCTGCATTGAAGSATVDFLGPNADHAISAFGASTTGNAEQVVGTMLLERAGYVASSATGSSAGGAATSP